MNSLQNASDYVSRYVHFYQKFLTQKWDNLTPMQYGTMIIVIAVFGWVLMRSARK